MIIVKQVMPQYGIVGERMTFILEVTNDTNFIIQSVMIYDELNSEFLYVNGSLKINGQSVQGSPQIGVSLGNMPVGDKREIAFDVEVLSKGLGSASNQATGSYVILDEATGLEEFVQVVSNEVIVQLIDITLNAVKMQNRDSATIGDIVNYTISLYNTGDLDLINITIIDPLSKALEVLPDSIRMNEMTNINYDIEEGIIIPVLMQGESVIINFSAIVKGCGCTRCILNTAYINTHYVLPNGSAGVRNYTTNTIGLVVGLTCFKQIIMNKDLKIPVCQVEIEDINDISASVQIDDTYTINTITGRSIEGQVLTGRKIVVNGIINVMLNYTGLMETQMVLAKEYQIPFGAYLVMPIECNPNDMVEVEGVIENINYTITTSREISVSISILLQGFVG